jgi:predicted Zn finger-like uncharacterized protein
MRVACPSCAAAYEVPDVLLTADRIVRCARCGENWKPMAPAAGQRDDRHAPAGSPAAYRSAPAGAGGTDEVSFADDVPEDTREDTSEDAIGATALPSRGARPVSAMERLAALAPPSHRPDMALTAAWVASVVLLVVVFAAALVWRHEVAHVWPATGRLYAWVGLPAAATAPPETLQAVGGQTVTGPAQSETRLKRN